MTQTASRLPLAFKLAYTAFLAVLIPVYGILRADQLPLFLRRGADRALVGSGSNPLLISMCAVGILIPQALWVVDFVAARVRLLADRHDRLHVQPNRCSCAASRCSTAGCRSCCSIWCGSSATTGAGCRPGPRLAWVLLLVCFFLMPPPRPDPGLTPVNINYVWGMSDLAPQTWVPPYVWLAGLMILLPVIAFVTHLLLVRSRPRPPRRRRERRRQ